MELDLLPIELAGVKKERPQKMVSRYFVPGYGNHVLNLEVLKAMARRPYRGYNELSRKQVCMLLLR